MELVFNPERKFKISCAAIERFCNIPTSQPLRDKNNTSTIKRQLSYLLNPADGIIDGDRIKEVIFPTFGSFNVFISHSHNNQREAEALAIKLRNWGYNPFLDNYVWSSADELLEEIDSKYCRISGSQRLDYKKLQFSSSHVHTMLSMSILEMIARCESFIFIESNDSIEFEVLKGTGERTQSPWLYQELQYVRMLSAVVKRQIIEQREFSNIQDSLKISYGANLMDFKRLISTTISRWFPLRI